MPNELNQGTGPVESQIEYRKRLAAQRTPTRPRNFKPMNTAASPPVRSPVPASKAAALNPAKVNALAEKLDKMDRKLARAKLQQLTTDDPAMAAAVRARLAIMAKLAKSSGSIQMLPVAPTNLDDALNSSRMTRPKEY